MKIKVLLFGAIGTILMFVARYSVEFNICTSLDYNCRSIWDKVENIAYFFPVILLFSLLTLKMDDFVFQAWWKFARVAIPVIFVFSTLINLQLHHSSGGFMNMDDMFDMPALLLMYTIFIVGSIIQIWKGSQKKR